MRDARAAPIVSGTDQERVARRSGSPDETERWGALLAPTLQVGDVLTLHGPLGAGKTCFVTGLARGLEVKARVRSPSFGLIHEMHGRLLLAHVDLYRLTEREAETLGLEELREQGALVVEWGERLPAALREEALGLHFRALGPNERELMARAHGNRGAVLLEGWRALDAAARRA